MLRSRITPCLLVHKKGLVKTVAFENPKYVGDPINAVKIFNEKEVDELFVIDIDARDRWIKHMHASLSQIPMDEKLREQLWTYLVSAAHSLVNTP